MAGIFSPITITELKFYVNHFSCHRILPSGFGFCSRASVLSSREHVVQLWAWRRVKEGLVTAPCSHSPNTPSFGAFLLTVNVCALKVLPHKVVFCSRWLFCALVSCAHSWFSCARLWRPETCHIDAKPTTSYWMSTKSRRWFANFLKSSRETTHWESTQNVWNLPGSPYHWESCTQTSWPLID